MSKDYEPLHQKYRPKCFDDLVGQESIALTLKQAITTNHIAPAYLFCGPRGTGKTSSARILARSLNCLSSNKPTIIPCDNCELCKTISLGSALDVIEIDAASNTGVDNIRELIEKSQFAPVKARWKIYVIDECHMLSTAAFNALLKTLEEPPNKVVFILATTDPQRVLPTIISRCQKFDFRRISLENLSAHLSMIASKEDIAIEASALEMIAKHAQGGLRDAESMLDQLSLLPPPIQQNSVLDLLGVIPENELLSLVQSLSQSEPISTLKICRNLLELGREPISILQGFASILRDLVISIAAPEQPELFNISNELHEELKKISEHMNLNDIFRWQAQLRGAENQLRHSLQPRLWLEVLFLGLLDKPCLEKKEVQIDIQASHKEKAYKPKINQDEIYNDKKEDPKLINKKDCQSGKIDLKEEEIIINTDLKEVWEKILSSLELPSTRMLLSQQASLIGLNEEIAKINVASNWVSMIQSRKILIEDAINKSIGSPRKLIIQTANELSRSQDGSIKEKVPTKINSEIGNPKKVPMEKNINSANSEINNLGKINEPNKIDISNNKDLTKFAEFFNGEIVDLE